MTCNSRTEVSIFTGREKTEMGGWGVRSVCASVQRRVRFFFFFLGLCRLIHVSLHLNATWRKFKPSSRGASLPFTVSQPSSNTQSVYLTAHHHHPPPLNHCLNFYNRIVFVEFLVDSVMKACILIRLATKKPKRKITQICMEVKLSFQVTAERFKKNCFNCHNSPKDWVSFFSIAAFK